MSAQETLTTPAAEPRKKMTALLLAFFLGPTGAHRFYVGNTKSAVLYLCTFGLFGIGTLVDLYKIITDQFTDAEGRPLVP